MYTKPKDIWNLTPAELDDLLRYAAWLVESPHAATGADRHAVASQLRRTAPQVNPDGYDKSPLITEPTQRGNLGAWTGD